MHLPEKEGKSDLRGNILFNEGWPKIKCQILDISRVEALADRTLYFLNWMTKLGREKGSLVVADGECCSK